MAIFGREHPGGHDLDRAIQELLTSGTEYERSLALNLVHDHRVTEQRERAFLASYGAPATGPALDDTLHAYHVERIREAMLPDFMDATLNDANILTDPRSAVRLTPDSELGRLLKLNGLREPLMWAKGQRRWRRVLDDFDPTRPVWEFLDRLLTGASPDRLEEVISTLLDAYGEHARAGNRWQPAWCTAWEVLEPQLASPSHRWLHVVGVEHSPGVPNWIVVLRYRVAEVGTLCRPSILDADRYKFHFPSPPTASLPGGGHPMDLDAVAPIEFLIPEYIHGHFPTGSTHWGAAGRRWARVPAPAPVPLSALRRAHHDRLGRCYGPAVAAWMPNPW